MEMKIGKSVSTAIVIPKNIPKAGVTNKSIITNIYISYVGISAINCDLCSAIAHKAIMVNINIASILRYDCLFKIANLIIRNNSI